jgi:hypothetical protein
MPRVRTLKNGVLILGVGVAIGSCAPAAAAPERVDPVVISPQYYAILLDSNHVRVLEYRLPPGRREAMHQHRPTWSTSSKRQSCEQLIQMGTARRPSSPLGRHCIGTLYRTPSRTSATRTYTHCLSSLIPAPARPSTRPPGANSR